MTYNFLTEMCRQKLNQNRVLILRFYGENTVRLKCLNPRPILYMRFVDDTTFANTNQISFYTNRPLPNAKWPWPLRNFERGYVRVDGFDLLNEQGYMLFKLPDAYHLYSGDTLEFKPGSIKVEL